MTQEERRGVENLLLLCGPHHDAVDSQLALHTTEFLRNAKRSHEEDVRRAIDYAMGRVGFKELQFVCDALVFGITVQPTEIEALVIPVDIDYKLDLNGLLDDTRNRVEIGLAQQLEVMKFLNTMDNMTLGFSKRLTSRFKSLYYKYLSEGVTGDDLFDLILVDAQANAGAILNREIDAAALAVIVHLFSICEIFEHVAATT